MNGEILSNEEDYAFDVAGYLHGEPKGTDEPY